jgi:hypothetical protein
LEISNRETAEERKNDALRNVEEELTRLREELSGLKREELKRMTKEESRLKFGTGS